MKNLFVSVDGLIFSTRKQCIDHELKNKLSVPCPVCKTKGYTYQTVTREVRKKVCDADYWTGEEVYDFVEEDQEIKVSCKSCSGTGYIQSTNIRLHYILEFRKVREGWNSIYKAYKH